ALDASGDAYITGYTDSSNLPTTVGAFQTSSPGGANAFVTKLNPMGTGVVYSTYVGSSGGDAGFGIAVDTVGSAYVVGLTDSTAFPTTPGAFQTTFGGGSYDAFISKLNVAGSGLVYSTYLGGNGFDEAENVAIDAIGNAYLTGITSSTNFPTANPFQAA